MTRPSGVYVCSHLVSGSRPISLIIHHSDGMWQLTCGLTDHPTDKADLHFVHTEHLLECNAQLSELLDNLPKGYLLEKVGGDWHKYAHDE